MKRTMAAKVLLAAGTASVALLTTACEVEEGNGDVGTEDPLLDENGGTEGTDDLGTDGTEGIGDLGTEGTEGTEEPLPEENGGEGEGGLQ